MPGHRIFTTPFSKVYPLYVQKAERKGRTKKEVDQIIGWLTGYSPAELKKQIEREADGEDPSASRGLTPEVVREKLSDR